MKSNISVRNGVFHRKGVGVGGGYARKFLVAVRSKTLYFATRNV